MQCEREGCVLFLVAFNLYAEVTIQAAVYDSTGKKVNYLGQYSLLTFKNLE